ncbi:hypothetical protein B6U90_00070 [Thermoplasmatales archaeon ex4484_6]|nr:MAG: hypothetical protein B6U90_00070 [Thermoplasmatales archaeon ex4484_6]RLF66385.1 MAG: hypothetical protein DRN57_07240 [Thermoplasmata archaeon]
MMIRKTFLVAVSVLVLVGVPIFSLTSVEGAGDGQDLGPGATTVTTDYEVLSGETKEITDEDWELNANIYVRNGGTLYINNTKIKWGGTTDGEYGLYVDNGGVLYIDQNCNFTAQDTTTHQYREKVIGTNTYVMESWGVHWKFYVRGTARINNSYFGYMWGETGGYITDHEGGIVCASDDIIIYNCVIQYTECNAIAILNPDLADYQSQGDGFSPRIDRVTIDNTTRYGIFVGGDKSSPTITNSTVRGAPVQGITYFVGADGYLNDTTISGCEDGLELDPVTGSGYSATLLVNRCHFDGNNNSGFIAGRGGTVKFRNSTFNNNKGPGVIMQVSTSSGIQSIEIYDSEVKNNAKEGLTALVNTVSAIIQNVEIAENGGNGIWLPATSNSAPYIVDSSIHDNGRYGIYSNGSAGYVQGTELYRNDLGNIFAVNGSTISISSSDIHHADYGIKVLDAAPSISDNDLRLNGVGVNLDGSGALSLGGNTFFSNEIGLFSRVDDVAVQQNNFDSHSSNTAMILDLRGDKTANVRFCNFTNNKDAVKIYGGEVARFQNISVTGSSGSALFGRYGANFTVRTSEFSGNTMDFILNDASTGKAFSCGTPSSKVTIQDRDSEFWHYWRVSVEVMNNVTLAPVTDANMVIYSDEGEALASEETFFDGTAAVDSPQYMIDGSGMTSYMPVNLTVAKENYIPFWEPDLPNTEDHHEVVYLAENRAPSLPFPPGNQPTITHQNRPLLTWLPPYDWNQDKIGYKVNVWQDDMSTGQHVVVDAIVHNPQYMFRKNLRYNHEFWVEVVAFDPWGLSDTTVFSFRTVNTPPTSPVASFVEAPVPSLVDLEVRIDNASTDSDTNPVDNITYLVEWYAFREDTWVIIMSGSNQFILDHNLTFEGDKIRAVIKPFDGIEYGVPVTLETQVVNFVPHALVDYVEIELNEDEPATGLINLSALFTDRDGDDLSFNVKIQRNVGAEIDKVTNAITFIPDPNWMGKDYLIIEALDSKPHAEDNPTIQVNITVKGVNDAPVITEVNDKVVEKGSISLVQDIQGATAVITVKGYDPDELYGDSYEFSTNFLDVIGEGILDEDDFMFERTTGRMSVFLKNAIVGEHIFNITVTDEAGLSSSTPIKLLVENRNDAPTVPEIISHTNGEVVKLPPGENKITFSASPADDPDLHIPDSEEHLEYDWNFGEGWIENIGFENVEAEFPVSGEYEIRVRVRDSMGLYEESSIKIMVNVTAESIQFAEQTEKTFFEEWGLILILAIIAVIVIAVILFLVFRKDELSDTAKEVEQEHEALVAKQQEEALMAQEKLQALMSGTPYPETTGPALPSAGEGVPSYEALPSAETEGAPPQEGAVEGYQEQPPVPGYEQQPPAEPGYEQPPAPAYQPPAMEEQPMQAPPTEMPPGTPEEQPPAAPEPAVPGAVPPTQPQEGQDPTYLPPPEEQQQ